MDEPLLRPPDQWTDELQTLSIDRLPLSYYFPLTERLPAGRTLADVEADLERGAWLARRRGSENVFSIGGSEFQLRVKSRPAKQGQYPIAHVLDVDEARSVPRRVGWLAPRRVRFYVLRDEARCDLEALETELARRLELTGEVRRRSVAQPELELHQGLHRAVRRDYGDLNTLIGLLEQRPVKPEQIIAGVVAGSGRRGRQQLIIVETGAGGLAEFRGRRVSLRLLDGRAFNTRVIRVQARQLYIAEPQDWPGKKDDVVEVAGIPPFGLRRNGQALEDFLAGRVEGAWHDLAQLVSRPGELTLPPLVPPQTFYCDVDPDAYSLNDEQRLAVTGAVASPHTFFVQGPPGTGKTEVISETIQQLVGRGERVLLLAPAHVAVDEVLKRVGRKPGMRPLRITFDDDKVDESVRAHLPQHVGVELINRVLRPTGPGQAERWAAELVVVERQLAALSSARSTGERLGVLRESAESSGRQAAEAGERLATYRIRSDRDLERAGAELAAAQRRHAEAKATDIDLAEVATALRAEWEPLLLETGAVAHGLSTAVQEEVAWRVRAGDAAREYRTRWHQHAEVLKGHDEGIKQLNNGIVAEGRLLIDAINARAAAERELRQVERAQGKLGHLASRVGLGKIADARRALTYARTVVDERQTARQNLAERLTEATGRRNNVAGRGKNWLEQLLDTAERNRQHAETASQRREWALRRMLEVLARYDSPASQAEAQVPADLAGDNAMEACGRLAAAVLDIVAAVTPPARVDGLAPQVEPTVFGGVLAGFVRQAGELWYADSARPDAQRALLEAETAMSARMAEFRSVEATVTARLQELDRADRDARALLNRQNAEATQLGERYVAAVGELRALDVEDTPEELARLQRRQLVLTHLPVMERRWRELVEDRTDDQLVEDIQTSALRATNLVCATTKGIVGRGSDVVRDTDYDTLIVDEASRVTDSEFLIGAVRARRWVLVGDERQLPPHVDQQDEHFLHALFALYRHHRGEAKSVDEAIDQLAEYWQEDTELREFRGKAVRELATELAENGSWAAIFQARMDEAYKWFAKRAKSDQDDPDRVLLRTMNQYLVRSLFERVVASCGAELKQPLKWQRRMPRPLALIVNEPVYGGKYLSPSDKELAKAGASRLVVPNTFDRPAVFVDTSRYRKDAEDSPATRGNGFENELEQRMILRTCQIYHDELDRTRAQPITVSVLSFYRAQAQALDDALDRKSLPLFDIKVVDVIDRIQGQQSDLVIISFVRARDRGAIGPRFGSWLQDLRRLNVACTRARRALVLVGHADTLRHLGTKRDGTPRDANAEPAVRFYKNLFDLFDGSSPDFLMLHKLDLGRAG